MSLEEFAASVEKLDAGEREWLTGAVREEIMRRMRAGQTRRGVNVEVWTRAALPSLLWTGELSAVPRAMDYLVLAAGERVLVHSVSWELERDVVRLELYHEDDDPPEGG